MGLSPTAVFGIGLGADLLGNALSNASTARQNRLNREWQEKMYGRQRQDSLADWNMQNEYNSPEKQMQRLKAAGLNPNLVYGNGATATGGVVRSSSPGNYQGRPADWKMNANESLAMYYSAREKDQTINNLKAQEELAKAEKVLKAAQVLDTLASKDSKTQSTASAKFDLEMKQSLKETALDMAKAELDKKKADIQYTLTQNEIAELMKQPNLTKAIADIAATRANTSLSKANRDQVLQNIQNSKVQGALLELEKELADQGIYKGDPYPLRLAAKAVNQLTNQNATGDQIVQGIQDAIKELKNRKKP